MINRETVDANILLIMAEQFSALSDLNTVDFPVEMPNLRRLANSSDSF